MKMRQTLYCLVLITTFMVTSSLALPFIGSPLVDLPLFVFGSKPKNAVIKDVTDVSGTSPSKGLLGKDLPILGLLDGLNGKKDNNSPKGTSPSTRTPVKQKENGNKIVKNGKNGIDKAATKDKATATLASRRLRVKK